MKIGTISVCFLLPSEKWLDLIQREYSPFIDFDAPKTDAAVYIEHSKSNSYDGLEVGRKKNTWEIRRQDFFSSSDISFRQTYLYSVSNKYSFDSWMRIFITLLGLRKSLLLIHGAGYFLDDYAYLFPGKSGTGKSTITRILGKENALSDELILLHAGSHKITAHSTPFWGELSRGNNKIYGNEPKGIFFLRHGNAVQVQRINQGEALKKLLSTVLFFAKDTGSLARMFDIASRILAKVPSYELTFSLKTKRDTILNHLRKTEAAISI